MEKKQKRVYKVVLTGGKKKVFWERSVNELAARIIANINDNV
jgi:hypothetical protein